jgi:hypothetical protein
MPWLILFHDPVDGSIRNVHSVAFEDVEEAREAATKFLSTIHAVSLMVVTNQPMKRKEEIS